MGWVPMAVMTGASLLGSLFGNRGGQKGSVRPGSPLFDYLKFGKTPGGGSSSTTRSSSLQTRNLLSMPEVSAEYRPMQGLINSIVMSRLQAPSALPAGYEQQGIIDTNRSFAGAEKALRNRMAASGTYGSPVQVAGEAYLQGQRGSEVADFRRSLPMVERQLRNEDIAASLGLIESLGRGMRETGTIREEGESNTSSSHSGGFDPGFLNLRKQRGGGRNTFGSLMDMVGFMAGSGMFGGRGGGRAGAQGVQMLPIGPNYATSIYG